MITITERTPVEIVNQAISDFDSIKEAILGHKVAVVNPTRTSLYGELIAKIRVGCIAGRGTPSINALNFEAVSGKLLTQCQGRTIQPLIGKAELLTY